MSLKKSRLKDKFLYGMAALVIFAALAGISALAAEKERTEYPIVCLGDSIFGQFRDETSIPGLLSRKLGVPVFNGAFGGTGMSRFQTDRSLAAQQDGLSMVALAQAIAYDDFGVQQTIRLRDNATEEFPAIVDELALVDFSKVDTLLIEHCVNDYTSGLPIYNEEDPWDVYTYQGALRTVLETLQKQMPGLRVILVTPTYSWFPAWGLTCETWNTGCGYLQDYVEVQKLLADEYGVELIDLYHDFYPVGREGDWELYTRDGLHPNEAGRELIADRLARYLEDNPEKPEHLIKSDKTSTAAARS